MSGAATEFELMQRLAAEHPTTYRGAGAVVERLADRATRATRAIFRVTLGAVALLLLIAAANVVNLQLSRAARREEEFAVRAALGAGRGRIARQLFAEGLLVAVADIGKDTFDVANQLLRRVRGGLGIATVAANAVFAAITGISIASAAVFTRSASPGTPQRALQRSICSRISGVIVSKAAAEQDGRRGPARRMADSANRA